MTQEQFEKIGELLDYIWNDELNHWEKAGKPDKHIFIVMQDIQKFLDDYQMANEDSEIQLGNKYDD